jgi:hypothetical protein
MQPIEPESRSDGGGRRQPSEVSARDWEPQLWELEDHFLLEAESQPKLLLAFPPFLFSDLVKDRISERSWRCGGLVELHASSPHR